MYTGSGSRGSFSGMYGSSSCSFWMPLNRAIACYLEGSLTNVADAPVFEWVEKYEKVAAVAQKALVLFRLSCKQAATLFVNHMEEVPVGVARGGEA